MLPFGDYAKDAVANGQASNAPIKRSTYGASVAAGVLSLVTLFNPAFEEVFGNAASAWLKFAVLGVILLVWAAIMVADTIARKVPPPVAGPAIVTTPGTKPVDMAAAGAKAVEIETGVKELEEMLRATG
jgi:hypothetical protein